MDIPLRPTAIVNFNRIDPKLANVVVNLWDLIWGQENPAIDMKTRLHYSQLISLLKHKKIKVLTVLKS